MRCGKVGSGAQFTVDSLQFGGGEFFRVFGGARGKVEQEEEPTLC
jgi:hypothetical protein